MVLATGMVLHEPDGGRDRRAARGRRRCSSRTILKLDYRQGPEVPNLRYGYPDSHFICFPYETRRTGIYAAGTVRRAMDMAAAKRDAAGAALKAIQCVEMISRGEAVHPRAGDQTYPEFFMQRCTQCKRCTEECPFGAINEDEKANPLPNPTRCRRCGVCMGACPERIISFKNYSVDMIGTMIKAHRGAGRGRGEALRAGLRLRERRLPGAGYAGPEAQAAAAPTCASSRCAAWAA